MHNTHELLSQYFRSKTLQLLAASDEAICEHSGLKGSHREDLIKIYLNHILPQRFDVGRGMVYGAACQKSKESDIVIWDSHNYPNLQMQGHSMFFAESVRLVLEVKTNFNNIELENILEKCEAVKSIVPMNEPNIDDEIAMLNHKVDSLIAGENTEGMIISKPHIATGAVIFRGGKTFTIDSISKEMVDKADDFWPDIMILLEAGKVIIKQYDDDMVGTNAYIEFFEAGDEALLLFTSSLLGLISDRSVNVEDPFYLTKYAFSKLNNIKSSVIPFKTLRFTPGRTII